MATPTDLDPALADELAVILREQSFDIHFQPLVDVAQSAILGYEALTRGPPDSPLHSPIVLFEVAAQSGRLLELERVVIRRAVGKFKRQSLPGQLFVNVTADTLAAAGDRIDLIAHELANFDFPTSRIVVELTETRPVLDIVRLGQSIAMLRRIGFIVALDDLGEGFASLKRWVDLRPDFVKIDRHFIDGIAADPLKHQFVRSILEMAASSGCTVVAEGVEQEADLSALRRMGVQICQGFLLGRPAAAPRASLRADVEDLLQLGPPFAPPGSATPIGGGVQSAARLARRSTTVSPAASCDDVVEMFKLDDRLYSVPVVDDAGTPIGILRSMQVLKRSSGRFFMDLYRRRSCVELMDARPLLFDVATSLATMSEAIASLDDSLMVDGFIVTKDDRYFGTGRTSDLLRAMSELQIRSARHANPLTLLPGNVPIDQHIEALLHGEAPFVVVTWDIDHFKPFNDVYGYHAGDGVIKFAAETLVEAADPVLDFVGHIGGDDFVLVLRSPDWETRVQQVCIDFDRGIQRFFSAEHVAAGGYTALSRQQQPVFSPLPTFSAGALPTAPGRHATAAEVSAVLAELKRASKAIGGGSHCFVDQRAYAPSPPPV